MGSLLLLRFTAAMRTLPTVFGKSFFPMSMPLRRGDVAAAPLMAHATALAAIMSDASKGTSSTLLGHPHHAKSHVHAAVLPHVSLGDDVVSVVFDGQAKQASTLLSVPLLSRCRTTPTRNSVA